jgi:hypothetical protein
MTRFRWAGLAVFLAVAPSVEGAPPPPRRLPRAVLEDKVRGGWAGQTIGVSYRRALKRVDAPTSTSTAHRREPKAFEFWTRLGTRANVYVQ